MMVISGESSAKEPSDSSDSATKTSPRPRTALDPSPSHTEPTTTVGSRFPARSTAAVMAVVEVLPCMPVTATWVWFFISSANNSPRRSTLSPRARAAASSGLSSFTAVEWTTTSASAQVFGPVAQVDAHPQVRQPPGDGAFGQVRAADAVPLAHQQLRQAAHADAADADEVEW